MAKIAALEAKNVAMKAEMADMKAAMTKASILKGSGGHAFTSQKN